MDWIPDGVGCPVANATCWDDNSCLCQSCGPPCGPPPPTPPPTPAPPTPAPTPYANATTCEECEAASGMLVNSKWCSSTGKCMSWQDGDCPADKATCWECQCKACADTKCWNTTAAVAATTAPALGAPIAIASSRRLLLQPRRLGSVAPPAATAAAAAVAAVEASVAAQHAAASRAAIAMRGAYEALLGDLRALAPGRSPGGPSGSFGSYGPAGRLGVSEADAQQDACLAGKKLCGAQGRAATAFSFFQWALSLAAAVLCTRRPVDREGRPHAAAGIFAALAALAGLLAISLAGNISQLVHRAFSAVPAQPAAEAAFFARYCTGTFPGADDPHPGYSFALCVLAWVLHLAACAACLHMRRFGALTADPDAAYKRASLNADHSTAYVALGEGPMISNASPCSSCGCPSTGAAFCSNCGTKA